IRRAGKVLINHNAVTAHYIEAIIDGIEMSGPYMVVWPGIALLHAKPSDGARALDLAVVRLKKPVVFGHPKHDPVRICVVLSTVNKVSHFRILYELSQIFIDELGLDTLINSVSKNAILNYLLAKCLALQQQNFSN
ncbi:MAG TPA: hypothetical protein DDZ66_02005, partial [Firmicutes bacterium]|nr:hypothetical protein [Bacillota bacterium]